MGTILSSGLSDNVYVEARRESFVIYTPFGEKRIELEYADFPALLEMLNSETITERVEHEQVSKSEPP